MGAAWLPSPSPSRKHPCSAYGDRAGPGTPSPGAGPGHPINSMTSPRHQQRLSWQLPLLMLIWASRQERCKIRPQRGFCVLGEGGWAGGALSIHLPPFPPFLCLVGAESQRRGGCKDPGALHSFQRGAASSFCRPCGQRCTPVQGLGVSGGSGEGLDMGCARSAKVMEQAASPAPGSARSQGHLAARIRPLRAGWGVFWHHGP